MRLACSVVVVGILVCVSGCDDGGSGGPGGGGDAGATDAQTGDPGVDAGASDAGAGDDAQVQPDAATGDAGTLVPDGCNYEGWMPHAVECGGMTVNLSSLRDPEDIEGTRCPELFELDGARFATLAEALASRSCSPSCVRLPSTSVSLIRCGLRDGYDVYEDPEGDCPEVILTRDGFFGSVREWEAASPCK